LVGTDTNLSIYEAEPVYIIASGRRLTTAGAIDEVLALKVMQYNSAWAGYYLSGFEHEHVR
jgi:hypothetical protein